MSDHRNGAIYWNETGKIKSIRHCFSHAELLNQIKNKPNTLSLFEGDITNDQYIDILQNPPIVRDKTITVADFDKLSILADGIETATLSNLPIPCTVYLDENPHIVSDGIFIFDTADIGDYEIYIDEVAYLRKDWIINAN